MINAGVPAVSEPGNVTERLSGRIDFDLEFQPACRLRNHIVSQLLPLAIGSPGDFDTVESPLADFREQIACQPQTEVETCFTCGLCSGHRFTIWFAERDTNQ